MSITSAPIVVDTRLGGLFVYGSGADGDVTISVNTTLTRDMQYNNLTINSGVNLDPAGYRVFVKETLTFESSSSTISRIANTTVKGTVGGGAAAGANAVNSLGGDSGDKTATQLDVGKEFYYDITKLISTLYVDATSTSPKFIEGGAGGSAGASGSAGADGEATAGSAGTSGSSPENANTVGAPGGRGGTGTPGIAGTGGAGGAGGAGGPGGGVVVVIAKTIVGSGKIQVNGISGSAGSAGNPGNAGTAGSYGSPAPSLFIDSTPASYNAPTTPVESNNSPNYTFTGGTGATANPNNTPAYPVAAYGFGAFSNPNNQPNYNYSPGFGATTNYTVFAIPGAYNTGMTQYYNAPTYPVAANGTLNYNPVIINYNAPSWPFAGNNTPTYNGKFARGSYNSTAPKTQIYNAGGTMNPGTPKYNYSPGGNYAGTAGGTPGNVNPTYYNYAPGNVANYIPGSNSQIYSTSVGNTNPNNTPQYPVAAYGFGSFTNANNTPNYTFVAGSGSTTNPNNAPNYTYTEGTPASYNYVPGIAASYNATAFYPGGAGGAGGTATNGSPGNPGSSGYVGGGGVLFVMSTSGIGSVTTSAAAGSSGQLGSSSAGTVVIINHSVIE